MALEILEALKKEDRLSSRTEPGSLRLCFTAEAERGGHLARHLLPDNEFTVEEISLDQ